MSRGNHTPTSLHGPLGSPVSKRPVSSERAGGYGRVGRPPPAGGDGGGAGGYGRLGRQPLEEVNDAEVELARLVWRIADRGDPDAALLLQRAHHVNDHARLRGRVPVHPRLRRGGEGV